MSYAGDNKNKNTFRPLHDAIVKVEYPQLLKIKGEIF